MCKRCAIIAFSAVIKITEFKNYCSNVGSEMRYLFWRLVLFYFVFTTINNVEKITRYLVINHDCLVIVCFAGEDNDADEDEGHNNEEHDKDISSEKEKLDDDQFSKTSEAANGEITIPILRRNGPLLQSQ